MSIDAEDIALNIVSGTLHGFYILFAIVLCQVVNKISVNSRTPSYYCQNYGK